MAEVLRKGIVVQDDEVIVERPDGSRRTVLVNITPIIDRDGDIIGAVNLVNDVTDRKRAEAARLGLLKRLEESHAALQEKIVELERFEDVVVGRELRMMDLERANAELRARLAKLGEPV